MGKKREESKYIRRKVDKMGRRRRKRGGVGGGEKEDGKRKKKKCEKEMFGNDRVKNR